MKALILAAGYALRLYPLTKECPKALLKVKDRPIIDYIIEKLEKIKDISQIIVVTNNKFFKHFKHWQKDLPRKKKIYLLNDLSQDNQDRKGAIGDICFALDKLALREDLLVIGADNLFQEGLEEFIQFTKDKKNSPVIGAYDIKNKKKAAKYGVLQLNRSNRIVDFQEKPSRPSSTVVAMCLYYFPRNKLPLIKEYIKTNREKDVSGFYIDWLRKKEAVYAYIFSGLWYDIGDLKFYKEANKKFNN